MSTPIDDLHVKQWVAVCHDKRVQGDAPHWMHADHPPSFTGEPLQIVAISLPFIAVSDGTRRFAIDARDYGLRKLHPTYVRKMRGVFMDHPDGILAISETEDGVPADAAKGLCPLCSTRLRERRIAHETWVFKCPQCGFEGGHTLGGRT
jgi:predicted RNA-binding Zn-ribbon protein involved in translation (DUF1610 family)